MRSLLWSYLGSRRFPREMSTFEVRRFFTLSSDDRHVLRRRFRSRSRLGAALQLGFVRMTGTTLDAFDYVPRAVLEHVKHQLGMSAPELTTLRALYRRQMTLFLHQRWACKHAGFRRHDASDVTHVIDTLSDSSVTLDRHRLARQACEALYARHCLIPGERDIEDWVRRAIYLVELQDRRHLDEVVSAKVRDSWLNQLMREKYPEPMTVLEWLRRPPRKRSRKTLDEEISKWLVIRAMTPPMGLDRIPAQRLRAYARRMRRRRPIKVREIAEPRRMPRRPSPRTSIRQRSAGPAAVEAHHIVGSAEHRAASGDRCAARAGQLLPRRLYLPVLRANLAGGARLERVAPCTRS